MRTVPHDDAPVTPKLTGNRCRCAACGEFFNSVSVFEAHRVGAHGPTRRCLSVDEMRALGWLMNPAGFWISRLRGESRAQARTRGQNSRLLPAVDPVAGAKP